MEATQLQGSPASEAHGPLDDLLRFAGELQAPSFVAPETFQEATQTVFPGLAGVLPGLRPPGSDGLGTRVRAQGRARARTGRALGTRRGRSATSEASGTFLWVDPEAGLATACLTDREFDEWALEAWPVFSDAVLEELESGS